MATPPPVCVCVCVCVCAWATGAVSQIAGGGHTSSGPVAAFTNGDCVSARFSTVTALTFGPTPAGYGGDSVVTVYAAEPNSNILRSITVNAGGSGGYLVPPPPHPSRTPSRRFCDVMHGRHVDDLGSNDCKFTRVHASDAVIEES